MNGFAPGAPMTKQDDTVAVIGAGIVGVSCALQLQRRGRRVWLIDRVSPGGETSYGNAGVLTRSSLVAFNNPALWRSLPRLLGNRSASFRYDAAFLARNVGWGIGFLSRARRGPFAETATALDALIRLSMSEHRRLLDEAGALFRLRETGWAILYRTDEGYARSRLAREVFQRFDVANETLDQRALRDLEPDLKPIFRRAIWVKDAASVDNPGGVVAAYASLFAKRGGTVERKHIVALELGSGGSAWRLRSEDGMSMQAESVVVALGPWSKEFLARCGLSVPMLFERGYHMHYAAAVGARLRRPVHDAAGGYVMSPMEQGVRLSTGVELADLDAAKDLTQLNLAEASARQAFPLGSRLEQDAWLGCRPTLPDSRPIIGEAPNRRGLWLAFGHQHIGFNTGPGTGALLAALMLGERPPIDPTPFCPARFVA